MCFHRLGKACRCFSPARWTLTTRRSGRPDLTTAIEMGCGSRIARDSWMIVTGTVNRPAKQREFLLLDRHGRMLLWRAQ